MPRQIDAEDLFELCGLKEDDVVGTSDEPEPAASDEPVAIALPLPAPPAAAAKKRHHPQQRVEDPRRCRSAIAGDANRPPDVYVARRVEKGGVGLHAARRKGEIVVVETAAAAAPLTGVRHCDGCLRSLASMADAGVAGDALYWPADAPAPRPAAAAARACAAAAPSGPGATAARGAPSTRRSTARGRRSGSRCGARDAPLASTTALAGLCGRPGDADALGLFDASGAAACRAAAPRRSRSFGVRLRSPYVEFHGALARRHGRGSKALREALGVAGLERDADEALRARCAVDAVGAIALVACANHDCSPNCDAASDFDAPTMQLVANRAIARDEELTISYFDRRAVEGGGGDAAANARRRRRYLRRNYLFDCGCDACASGSGG
ncbi:hypothetical protein JL721_234 [Aureococcus anophagefferens]|nr:hypothetical protein JL721_234 [Aureococcus anophagefferens]